MFPESEERSRRGRSGTGRPGQDHDQECRSNHTNLGSRT